MAAHTARGLRRAELTSTEPWQSAAFHQELLGWRVLPSHDGLDCWVGERRCATIRDHRPAERPGWTVLFSGTPEDATLTGPDESTANLARGRAQHGPWAPAPRRGEPCWIDLLTHDAERADDFWTGALNWQKSVTSTGETTYTCHGQTVAARRPPRLTGEHGWLCYFAVGNVELASKRVRELGGEVVQWLPHPMLGEIVVVADPHGAVHGLAPDRQAWGHAGRAQPLSRAVSSPST